MRASQLISLHNYFQLSKIGEKCTSRTVTIFTRICIYNSIQEQVSYGNAKRDGLGLWQSWQVTQEQFLTIFGLAIWRGRIAIGVSIYSKFGKKKVVVIEVATFEALDKCLLKDQSSSSNVIGVSWARKAEVKI